MNVGSIPSTDLNQSGNNASESDSDGSHDEYYEPISNVADDDDDGGGGGGDVNSDEDHTYNSDNNLEQLPNGHLSYGTEDRMMSSLAVADDDDNVEEEEERRREASEREMRRAFTEDENRRNAPLSAENAMRVREAMRGVSFAGMLPHWASNVPEDQWLDQLRRLRHN